MRILSKGAELFGAFPWPIVRRPPRRTPFPGRRLIQAANNFPDRQSLFRNRSQNQIAQPVGIGDALTIGIQ